MSYPNSEINHEEATENLDIEEYMRVYKKGYTAGYINATNSFKENINTWSDAYVKAVNIIKGNTV